MATPSVLTVPSMYGDGILYSGPSVYGPELASQPVDLQTDFVNNSGGTITSANTFDTFGGNFDGIASLPGAFSLTVGTTYEIEIRGTTTSDGFTLGDLLTTGNQYGSGFGVHRFISLNTRLWIRQNNTTGTTTITHLSIRQVTQGSDFEFTRATTGTRINEDGYIEDVPYNLFNYSEQLDNAYWVSNGGIRTANQVIAPDGTLTADKFLFNAFASGVYTSAFPAGTYTMSIFIKPESGDGLIRVGMGLNNSQLNTTNLSITNQGTGVGRISSAANGFYRFVTTFTTTSSTAANIYNLNTNTVIAYIWGAQLVKGDQPKNYLPTTDRVNLPRLNYPVYGGCPSLLVEPQRTNEVTYSQDFTQGVWNKNNVTVTSNQAISPEGIQNADKLVINNGTFSINGGLYIQRTGVVNQDVSFSVFAKAGEFRYGTISYGSSAANGFHFDLQDGVILSTFTNTSNYTNIGYEMIAYPNGWYRLVVNTTEKTTTNRYIGIRPHNTIPTSTNNNYTSTGNGTSGIFVYGAQLEVGSYATSLIHTSGSTVTRNEEQVQDSGVGTTDTFNSSEGVLYAEVENLAEDGNNKCISINDGSANNRVTIVLGTATNQIRPHVLSGGTAVFDEDTFTVPTSTQFNKIAVKYKANDFSLFVDGVKVASDTSGAAPIGLNSLDLHVGNSSLRYFGNVKAVAVYKTALTDTELANLTSYNNHDLFIPYRSRMQMMGADQELQCTEHDITRFL